MIVVDGGTVVVLLGVSERLFGVVGEMRHMLFILIVRVVTFGSHRVIVVSVETAMMHRGIIEVLGVVMCIMMSVLNLMHLVFIEVIRIVMHGDVLRLNMVGISGNTVASHVGAMMMKLIQMLNVVIILMFLVVLNNVGSFMGNSVVVSIMVLVATAISMLALGVISLTVLVLTIIIALLMMDGVFVLSNVAAVILRSVVVGCVWGAIIVVGNNVLVAFTVVNGHLLNLNLVGMVLVVVGIRSANLLGVSVVVNTLGDSIVLLRSSDSEVLGVVLLVIIVVGIVLVTVSVLRGHVVVSRVLIVIRANFTS